MRTFEDLVAEAEAADVTGWGFGWLDGRATEERPPWGYVRLLAQRLGTASAVLDVDTGGGEVLAEALALARGPRADGADVRRADGVDRARATVTATEGWSPNAVRARDLLGRYGVRVVESAPGEPLPFPDRSFDLVVARHPVTPGWAEIQRVLVEGGEYVAQHVGPRSAFELIERFVGPIDERPAGRDPDVEAADARAAGLVVDEVRTARCRMEFRDIGAVVWTLRKCVWWVPDFTVARYRDRLLELDARMRAEEPFVAHSTRHLVVAHRPRDGEGGLRA